MAFPPDRPIYLASRSPRRRELLGHIGVKYQLLLFRARPEPDAEVSEAVLPGEAARAYVLRVARLKARAGWQRLIERRLPEAPVLAADTTVVLGERILGKPGHRDEAAAMLASLSGKTHAVMTAIALADADRLETALSVSQVVFRPLQAHEIDAYVAGSEWEDKAGGYAIQGQAARFVAEIHGSHSGIVGLPLFETAQLLERLEASRERRRAQARLR